MKTLLTRSSKLLRCSLPSQSKRRGISWGPAKRKGGGGNDKGQASVPHQPDPAWVRVLDPWRLYFSGLFLVLAKNKWAAEKKSCCGIKTRGDILLVYRRPMGFYILILYPVTFLNSINLRDSFDQFSCILDWESYHFQIVIFFFPLYIPTFFFPPLN